MKGIKSTPILSVVGSPLPGLMQSLAEFAVQRLGATLSKMFDELDDQFFELAEESQSNTDQNLYFEAMRDVRIGRRGLEQTFKQNLFDGFRIMCCSPTETEGSPSPLSDSELELEPVLERMIRKCQAIAGVDIYQLTTRFNDVNSDVNVTEKNNALGPQLLCGAFSKASEGLNVDIKIRMLVLKLFDRFVLHTLPNLLHESNQILSDAGVLPELSKQLSNASNEQLKPAVVERNAGGGAFTQLQQLMGKDGIVKGDEVDGFIASLSVTQEKASLLNKKELISLLSSLQRQINFSDERVPVNTCLNLSTLVLGLLNDRRDQFSGSQLAKEDEDKLYLVQKLFSAIFDDNTLPELIKASIGRLQIPLVKVAILDAHLFDEKEHVARALINTLATMGLECRDHSSTAQEITYAKVEEVVQRIVREFDDDQSVFEREYNEISLFNIQDKRKLQQKDERAQLASNGKEKAELARMVVKRVLDQLLKNKEVPKVLNDLFDEGWSNLLLVTLLKEGVESEAWTDYLLTTEEIVWSVQPGKDSAARQRLLKLVPRLLAKLREGLTKVAYNAYEMSLIFSSLEQAHLLVLGMQSRSSVLETVANSRLPTASSAFSADNPVVVLEGGNKGGIADITRQIVEKSQQKFQRSTTSLSAEPDIVSPSESKLDVSKKTSTEQLSSSQSEALVERLSLGAWFVVNRESGGKYRCKLAAHLTAYDRYIFVNRTGAKVMERGRASLISALAAGEMLLLKDTQLFDRALQSVVNDLRGAKKPSI